jgi:hypothetical protein
VLKTMGLADMLRAALAPLAPQMAEIAELLRTGRARLADARPHGQRGQVSILFG